MTAKCINCGETMQPYYARGGSTMFICPNVRITIKKQGLVPYGYKFCNIGKQPFNPVMDMLIQQNMPNKPELSPLLVDSRECAELHAKLLTLKQSFEKLAKTITLEQLKAATHNTISNMKLLESANLALVLGLNEDRLPKLFEAGMKLGYAVGLTSEKAIESLCKGIARQSRLILDNIGITFTAEQAYEWYKTEHNAEKLGTTEKRDAWRGYAIKKVIDLGETLETNEKQIKRDQARARIENLKAVFGKDLAQ